MRALFGERRLDVAPLARAEVHPGGEGPRRLNLRTRRVDVATRAGKASFELATLKDLGDGGALVCRFLLDLLAAVPGAAVCGVDEVPLRAELRWATRGALTFEVGGFSRQTDLAVTDLAAPPANVAWTSARLPEAAGDTFVARSEMAAFRSFAVDVPPTGRDAQAPPADSGLTLVNSSDELRVAWLDGAPVAWVAPSARISLGTLLHGKYVVQWRTFLGDGWEGSEALVVPGVSEIR
jgi:hypothetical protein